MAAFFLEGRVDADPYICDNRILSWIIIGIGKLCDFSSQ
jgi:hypothetical protein